MKSRIALIELAFAVLFSVIPVIAAGAKDINLGCLARVAGAPYLILSQGKEGSSIKKA